MRRPTWRRVALALAVLVVADVVAAQLVPAQFGRLDVGLSDAPDVRCRHDVYHHGLRPLVSVDEAWAMARYPLVTNSLGLRDATPREIPPDTGRPRLLLIGDSFTEGVGVAFPDTYAGRIAAHFGAQDIDVLNASVMSYAPSIYYAKVRYLLETEGLRLDHVVVFVDTSDAYDEATRYVLRDDGSVGDRTTWTPRWERRRTLSTWARAADAVKSNSLIARLVHQVRVRTATDWDALRLTEGAWNAWPWIAEHREAVGEPGLALASAAMDRLDALLDERGIGLTVVVYPWPQQMLHDRVDSLQVTHWRSWSDANDASFIDLFPPFWEDPDRDGLVRRITLPRDAHFNAAGHEIVADEFLQRFGWPAR